MESGILQLLQNGNINSLLKSNWRTELNSIYPVIQDIILSHSTLIVNDMSRLCCCQLLWRPTCNHQTNWARRKVRFYWTSRRRSRHRNSRMCMLWLSAVFVLASALLLSRSLSSPRQSSSSPSCRCTGKPRYSPLLRQTVQLSVGSLCKNNAQHESTAHDRYRGNLIWVNKPVATDPIDDWGDPCAQVHGQLLRQEGIIEDKSEPAVIRT